MFFDPDLLIHFNKMCILVRKKKKINWHSLPLFKNIFKLHLKKNVLFWGNHFTYTHIFHIMFVFCFKQSRWDWYLSCRKSCSITSENILCRRIWLYKAKIIPDSRHNMNGICLEPQNAHKPKYQKRLWYFKLPIT